MAAVKGIIEKKNTFLAIKMDLEETTYTLPGGRIDYGESHEEALKREIREETTLDATIGSTVGTYHFFIGPQDSGDQLSVTVFDIQQWEGEAQLVELPDDEAIEELIWVEKDSISDYNFTDGLDLVLRQHFS